VDLFTTRFAQISILSGCCPDSIRAISFFYLHAENLNSRQRPYVEYSRLVAVQMALNIIRIPTASKRTATSYLTKMTAVGN
jgi:hypothetical protein